MARLQVWAATAAALSVGALPARSRGHSADIAVEKISHATSTGGLGVSYVALTKNVPYLDSVYSPPGSGPWANYVYFTFAATAQSAFMVTTSTLTDGKDVDMVMDAVNPTPTVGNATFVAATDYVETFVVPSACPGSPGGTTCTYYIGVAPFTWGQHSFNILVGDPSPAPATLGNGVPQNGVVALGGWAYFTLFPFTVTLGTSPVTLSLESLSGDPDVYVGLSQGPPAAMPAPSTAAFSLAGFAGSNLLIMPNQDPRFNGPCPLATVCTVTIGVYGYTASSFIVTAATNNAVVNLTDGLATSRVVAANGWSYFSYLPTSNGTISIAVTALSGDPDVYVSATTQFPTQASWTWASATPSDEVIFIATTDPAYVPPPGGIYYIGVFGYGANATFTVMAYTQGSGNAMRLMDGVPQAAASEPHSIALFSFNVSAGFRSIFGLDVFVTPMQGEVSLYVSNLTDGLGNTIYPVRKCGLVSSTGACLYWVADPATYTYTSTLAGSGGFVTIPPSALSAGQMLGVGVLAMTPDQQPSGALPAPSIYSITATTGNTVVELQSGVPVPGVVIAGQMKYYKVTISIYGADFVISADVAGGSLDLFAAEGSVNPRPVPGNSTYNTTQSGGILKDKILRVPFTSLSSSCKISLMFGSGACELYVTVQGYANMGPGAEASYSIVAQATGSPLAPLLLPNGQAQYVFIPNGGAEYLYSYAGGAPGTTFYIVVNNVLGSSQLFLNLGTSGKGFYTPGSATPPDWVSVDAGGYERIIMTNPNITSIRAADFVVSLGRDATTGLVVVEEAGEGAVDARVVEHLPNGAALVEVRLPGVHGETVTVVDGGVVRALVPALSLQAQRMGAGPWATSALERGVLVKPSPPATTVSEGVEAGLSADPLGPPPYCNPCELFVTVAATNGGDCYAQVSFYSGGQLLSLSQQVPQYGMVSPLGAPALYSFLLTDPLADVTLTFNRIFGAELVYISVQQPTAPWVVPGPAPATSTWQFNPNPFTPSFTILHTDPNFCNPGDGTAVGAPCTLLIAVLPRDNQTAAYTITASAGIQPLPVLIDGEPQSGQVTEVGPTAAAVVAYYAFQPSPAGYPTPATILSWTNLFGQVQAYVTNQYVPGVSPSSLLPGPSSTSCNWACTNYSGCYMAPGDPCFLPYMPGGTPIIYTIAIVGYTGIPSFSSSYSVVATVAGDPTQLLLGVPTTDIFVPNRVNAVYSFEMPDSSSDLVISATVNKGDVVLMVAHDDPTNGTVPGCNPPAPGSQLLCSGYTWQATGVGESVIYVPATSPCQPVLPPGTMGINVGGQCANNSNYNPANAFRGGRFWVVVYGTSDFSELSLTVNVLRGAAPRYLLADGQPQDVQTGPLMMCPNDGRDPVTGACLPTKLGTTFVAQGALFVLRVPSIAVGDLYVQVERLCGGNTTGICGPPLMLAANGCPEGSCNYTVPYADNVTAFWSPMYDAMGGVWIPFGACYPPGSVGPAACIYTIGVYSNNGPDPTRPGYLASSALFRVTLASPAGIQRIAQDCYSNGKVCTLPEHMVASGNMRRYEIYSGTSIAPVPVRVSATLCTGDPTTFRVFACVDGGACGQVNTPSAGNNDYSAVSNLLGQATMLVSRGTDIVFLGVMATGKSGYAFPTFQLQFQAGNGPVFGLDPADPTLTVYRDPSITKIIVAWTTPIITQLNRLPMAASNVEYWVHAFPTGSAGQSQLNNPCGIIDAVFNSIPGAIIVGPVTGNIAVLSGASTSVTYDIAVTSFCPASSCMLYSQEGQRIAFPASQSYPIPPAPSASPSPGSQPANNAPKASAVGPAVGASLGALLAVGAGFIAYRRFSSGGGSSSAYARPGGGASWMPSLSLPSFSFGGSSGAGRYGYVPSSAGDGDMLSGSGGGYVAPIAGGGEGVEEYSAL